MSKAFLRKAVTHTSKNFKNFITKKDRYKLRSGIPELENRVTHYDVIKPS